MSKVFQLLKIVMVIAMLVGPATVLAQQGDTPTQGDAVQQDADGQQAARANASTPARALAIDDQWRTLNPGEVHWYAFQYDGHFELRDVDDEDDDDEDTDGDMASVFVASDVTIWADSVPDDSVNFAVWSRDNIDAHGLFRNDTFGTDLARQPQDGTGPVGFDAECEEVDGDVC